ncbi:MAG: bile acid:sodium symporter family protein [Halobacteriaceae archaeon]
MNPAKIIEEYLLPWILLSVGAGILFPSLSIVTRASTIILAVMIGSISMTLSIEQFREIRHESFALILLGHITMPFLAFSVARVLNLSPDLVVGFVILGAVTPELVTPVMTELADGHTALSTIALVAIGVGSVVFIPGVVGLLVRDVDVSTMPIVKQLIVAVVIPMMTGVGLRAWQPDRVGRFDRYYPPISALMVILIIGGVTAANAGVIRSNASLVVGVGVGVIILNGVGYVVGYLLGTRMSRETRIASILSIGMRDFAVAAALGIVEMITSTGLARWFSQDE